MPMSWGTGYWTYQSPYVPSNIDSWFIRSWERVLAIGELVLHLPVTLRTRRYCFLGHSVLGEGISYWGTSPALTSDHAYTATLFPGLFGPGIGC